MNNDSSFYLTMHSNSSLHYNKKNNAGHFKIHFNHVMNLPGKWEVALSEVHIPMSMKNIRKPDNEVHVMVDKKCTLYHIPEKFYSDNYVFIEELNKQFKKEFHLTLQNNGLVTTKFFEKSAENVDYILPISLKRQLGYADGTKFDGKDAHAVFPPNINRGLPQSLHLLTNIIKPQIVNNQFENLLKIIPINVHEFQFGCNHSITFPRHSYLPLAHEKFDVIEMDIRDENMKKVSFEFGVSTVVLHFRQCS
jgi:hypothetical protein